MNNRLLIFLSCLSLFISTEALSSPFQTSALGLNLINVADDDTDDDVNLSSETDEEQLSNSSREREKPNQQAKTKTVEIPKDSPTVASLDKPSSLLNTRRSNTTKTPKGRSDVFQAFPKDTPELMPRSIKIELTDSQELIPELGYSFKFGNFITAIDYQSLKSSSVANIGNFSDSVAGKNRMQNQLKLYPMNWVVKLYDVHLSFGTFYSRFEMERTEFGVITPEDQSQANINFNNEVLLTGEQFGFQGAFLYSHKYFSLRGMVDFPPFSRLGVTEKSLFRIQGDKTNRESSSGNVGTSVTTKMDLLVKTPWIFDVNLNASYDKRSVAYQQTLSTYSQNGGDITYESAKFSSDIVTFSYGAGIYINVKNATELLPYFEAKMIQQSIADNDKSDPVLVSAFLVSIGFSSQF